MSGQPFADKPPLLTWLLMGSYRLFGVHDWAARLVAGAAGFATVLLTWFWGRRLLGERAALAGALVLCLSAHFVYLGRLLTTDSLLTACVVASWACSSRRPLKKGDAALFPLVAAIGAGLRAGPADQRTGCVGPGDRAGDRLSPAGRTHGPTIGVGWALFFLTAIGLAAPWYAAQEVAQPGFLVDFLWRQHVVRFATPFDHEEPAWFFLPRLVLGMLPWTLLLPGFVRFLGRHGGRAAARRPAALGFVLLAFAWSLLFFSASGCKRATYILPVMPPLALALGCYLDAIACAVWRPAPAVPWLATVLPLPAAPRASSLSPALPAVLPREPPVCCVGRRRCCWPRLRGSDCCTCPNPNGATGRGRSWGLCIAATFALLFSAVYGLLPGYARKFSLRGQVRPWRRRRRRSSAIRAAGTRSISTWAVMMCRSTQPGNCPQMLATCAPPRNAGRREDRRRRWIRCWPTCRPAWSSFPRDDRAP